jgi:hypothetical protein
MVILVYFISLVVFYLSSMLVGGVVNILSAIIGVKFAKNAQLFNTFPSQLISTFAQGFIGCYFAFNVFHWFNKTPIVWLAVNIYFVFWLLFLSKVPEYQQPLAQKIGIALGLITAWTILAR